MKNKIENYFSIVIVAHNDEDIIVEKLHIMEEFMKNNYKAYEIIMVDNFSTDNTLKKVNESKFNITIIELSRKHNRQQALRAGVDLSIGDYIVEIEDVSNIIDMNILVDLYNECQTGYDFVFLTPKNVNISSRFFYTIVNNYFANKMSTNVTSASIVLSSRRGQNKLADTGNNIVNRNIAYSLSGLNCKRIIDNNKYKNSRKIFENVDLMLDTFIYYTNIITRLTMLISLLFFTFSTGMVIYGVFSHYTSTVVAGWTSTVTFMGVAFSGIFLMFAIITKYLFHILNHSADIKNYNFKSITKK